MNLNLISNLNFLESESIFIIRELVAESFNPVLLYSVGKDSSVLLHIVKKAFFPNKVPFPLLHVDTTWKFQDMYKFRDDYVQKELGFEIHVHSNTDAVKQGINPFDHGSKKYTDIMKTQALKKALTDGEFDAAFGGARRDEEKSRAKERVFSFRDRNHRWDPKAQRPELWNLYNGEVDPGETIRVFPLSNWTELDIWQYVLLENIKIVPLYLASKRPVVMREGNLIMVDDKRMRLRPGENSVEKMIRFRTLGCYPLSGAIESNATTLSEVIQEMLLARTSERQGRLIDFDQDGSMEEKKKEGYF